LEHLLKDIPFDPQVCCVVVVSYFHSD
jgi:hypothetical protein